MSPQDDIRQTLLKELGVESLPPQAQQEAIAAAGGPLLQSVMLDIFEKIPQAQQADFQKALQSGDHKGIEALITANIPDSSAFIEQSVTKAVADFQALSA